MSIEITIDGKQVTGAPGETILEVAQRNGIHIPTLCTHARLTPTGACRVCVVDIGRMDRLEAACTTPISKGMNVDTKNTRVTESRRVVVSLLLDNLNADPETLENHGENVLLDLAHELGVTKDRKRLLRKPRPSEPIDKRNPVITREPDKCILCERCVNACNELKGYGVLNLEGRGYSMRVISGVEQPLLDSGCASCGECAEVCPTGAFKPLPREQVQEEIENVINTGSVYPVSSMTQTRRKRLGLPPLEEQDTSDLKKIMEKTGAKPASEGGDCQ